MRGSDACPLRYDGGCSWEISVESQQPLSVSAAHVTFGDLLRHLRRRAYMTQRDLALATGYSMGRSAFLSRTSAFPISRP